VDFATRLRLSGSLARASLRLNRSILLPLATARCTPV
jgi:hypothetical protein